jgi:hypothetical protein
VSDLKYWNSEAARTYMVKEIPLYFLIGPDGKIIAKTTRLPDVEKKLDEIL